MANYTQQIFLFCSRNDHDDDLKKLQTKIKNQAVAFPDKVESENQH